MDDDRYTRITLRIPRDLHRQLEVEALRTSKSLNAEIVGRLRASFDETVVTTVQPLYRPGPEEVGVAFDADQIADKVIERLQRLNPQRTDDRPMAGVNKIILGGRVAPDTGRSDYGSTSYLSYALRLMERSSTPVTKKPDNTPHGPKSSPNAKKRPPSKT